MNLDITNREKETIRAYRKYLKKSACTLVILLVLFIVLSIASICTGASGMSVTDVISALVGIGDETNRIIVQNIRLPRVIAAILSGIGLASAGCVMQTVLKNPVASPSTLGVSNAAVFGANFAIIFLGGGVFHSSHGTALTFSNPYLVTLCAFICALGSILLILLLSGKGGFLPETVVLAGVAMGSLFSAGTAILQYFAIDTQLSAAVFWTFGDLGRASVHENILLALIVLPAFLYFTVNRWRYNALSSGEDTAKSLGVHTDAVRFWSLLFASMICAVCVSFLGIIGFIGLVAPQLMKRITGNDHRFLLPCSALCGAVLLLFSDILARSLLADVSLPVGAITSLMGGPMFLWILLSKKSRQTR